jgi:transposase
MKTTRMSDAVIFPARLTDEVWSILEPLVPANKAGGRPPKYSRRAIVDAIFYVVRQGCTWRALPADLPHWNTVFWYFDCWQQDGTWDKIEDALRRAVRLTQGREAEPSAGVADSQTVRGTEQPGPRGYDGGKKNHRRQAARLGGHHRPGVGAGNHAGGCGRL